MRLAAKAAWVVALALSLSACVSGGVRHGYIMRGQVLAIEGDVVSVCIGTQDGAKVGEELDVRRITTKPGPPKSGPSFVRTDIGRVRIVELFDEHYAHAKVLSGEPQLNDVVEFRR